MFVSFFFSLSEPERDLIWNRPPESVQGNITPRFSHKHPRRGIFSFSLTYLRHIYVAFHASHNKIYAMHIWKTKNVLEPFISPKQITKFSDSISVSPFYRSSKNLQYFGLFKKKTKIFLVFLKKNF